MKKKRYLELREAVLTYAKRPLVQISSVTFASDVIAPLLKQRSILEIVMYKMQNDLADFKFFKQLEKDEPEFLNELLHIAYIAADISVIKCIDNKNLFLKISKGFCSLVLTHLMKNISVFDNIEFRIIARDILLTLVDEKAVKSMNTLLKKCKTPQDFFTLIGSLVQPEEIFVAINIAKKMPLLVASAQMMKEPTLPVIHIRYDCNNYYGYMREDTDFKAIALENINNLLKGGK